MSSRARAADGLRVGALVGVDEAARAACAPRRVSSPARPSARARRRAPPASRAPAAARCWPPATLVSSSVRGLRRRPAQHVAQDQRGALAGGSSCIDGEEGELDRLARDDHGVRLAPRVGATSSSSRSGYGCSHGTSANEPSAVRLPRAAPQRVEARVRRDPVQPRAEQRAAVERLAAAPRAQERLLHEVLGLVERAEHPVAVDVELAAVALGQRGRRRPRHRRDTAATTAASSVPAPGWGSVVMVGHGPYNAWPGTESSSIAARTAPRARLRRAGDVPTRRS